MKIPICRRLRGYAFDPSFSSTLAYRLTNEVIYNVPWESDLQPGPIGEYIEVIDYDPTRQAVCEPVDLNDKYILAGQGLPLMPHNPKFHQQQVYAVAMDIIQKFEAALGRKIIFSRRIEDDGLNKLYTLEYVPRLRIYPHAMCQENAYYSPEKVALLFGYFRAKGNWSGNNIPNSVIFTCLSPDIVAHECTHAILDSMLPFLNKNTNPDMLAFHEAFADSMALLQRLSIRSVVFQQIMNSRGDLYSSDNILGDIASQFGQALSGNRRALRSYLITQDEKGVSKRIIPDPSKYHNTEEVHERGAILVAAIFDAFARLYNYRTADLLRIASEGSGILKPGAISTDLANRLTDEVCYIANRLMQICIRALDYCPTTDMIFSDYLRAIITADLEHSPEDEDGMRYSIMEAFRSWGIVPEDINTYSIESVTWEKVDDYWSNQKELIAFKKAMKQILNNPDLSVSIEKILREENREIVFNEINKISGHIHELFNYKLGKIIPGTEKMLGLDFAKIEYTLKQDSNHNTVKLKAEQRKVFQVYKCRPFIRTRSNRSSSSKQIVVSFLQKVYVDLKGSPYEGYFPNDQFAFRGGASVVIDLSTFEVQYIIAKSVRSSKRLKKQLDYAILNQPNAGNDALMLQENEPFAAIHLH
jgi:hypothetical protein